MGSIGNTGRIAAFQSDVFASGLDLGRSEIIRDLGVYRAADAATILQGQMVSLDANGELALANLVDIVGVAKWNKAAAGTSVQVDEAVTVVYGGVTQLSRGNVSNLAVRAAAGGGTLIPETDNYTLSAANGTLTWDNPPTGTAAPANGATVFVTYTFDLTATDYRFQGLNFFNRLDDVGGLSEGRLTIVQGPATLFTTQFVTSEVYAVGAPLFCTAAGLFTVTNSSSELVGHVVQPPTADDPFLGLNFQAGRAA
jgi:hypothetical protein